MQIPLPKDLALAASFFFLSIFSFGLSAQVGINTTEPITTLDVNGALSLRESPTALRLNNGMNTDVVLPGSEIYSVYRINRPTAAFGLDGIKVANLTDGQIIRLINTTNFPMTIVHNTFAVNTFSILCPSNKNLILNGQNSSVTLQYSKELSRWTVVTYASTQTDRITVFGTTDIARQNSSWAPLDGLEITFIPTNRVVYLVFNAYGGITFGNADFQLLMNGNYIPNSYFRGVKDNDTYQASLSMFPLIVTPGIPITIEAQWYRAGVFGTLTNYARTNPNHGRFLTIID